MKLELSSVAEIAVLVNALDEAKEASYAGIDDGGEGLRCKLNWLKTQLMLAAPEGELDKFLAPFEDQSLETVAELRLASMKVISEDCSDMFEVKEIPGSVSGDDGYIKWRSGKLSVKHAASSEKPTKPRK